MSAADSRFLVMGLKGLVRRDLIGTMLDTFPTLAVTSAADVSDALSHIKQTSGWQYAFLNLGPDAFIASELYPLLTALGTKVVLLGSAAEDAVTKSPFPVLVRPFISDDIFRVLKVEA